ncbi:MAG: tetratricopeptide repeat protein [Bacteroidota bacterium]|jgi:tetratricopeptide (TPR) repeat protein
MGSSVRKTLGTSGQWMGIQYQWLIALLGMLLYVQTLGFEYTLDDDLFVKKNILVNQGIAGLPQVFSNGSLVEIGIQPYRPVTLTTFAIGKSLHNNQVAIEHLVNVLLYGFLLLLLFNVLRRLMDQLDPLVIAGMCLLFALHPLHTEVVASVKSRDELLAACFGLLSWNAVLRLPKGSVVTMRSTLTAVCWFALAAFSKESGIVFLVLIPLSLHMLHGWSLRESFKLTGMLGIAAAVYLFVRYLVIGTEYSETDVPLLANVLNGTSGFAESSATRMVILYHNLRLLIAPWPLVWDRSYNQIPLSDWSSVLAWAGILLYGALAILALFNFRKRPVLSFGILFFFIASSPTNNLFLVTGAVLGERFLFTPSLGLCILLPWFLSGISTPSTPVFGAQAKRRLLTGLALIGSVYAILCIMRIPDWKNNLLLFERGVEDAPNSARTNYALASEFMREANTLTDPTARKARYAEASEYFKRSLDILPINHEAQYNAGMCAALFGDTTKAIQHYREAITLRPSYFTAMNNLAVLFGARLEFDSAQLYYERVLALRPKDDMVRSNLSNLHFGKGIFAAKAGDSKRALGEYRISLNYQPSNVKVINNTASLYAGLTQYDSALVYLFRAYSVEPSNLMVVENIASVSLVTGQLDQAIEFGDRALALNPRSVKALGVLVDAWSRKGNALKAGEYSERLRGF